MSEATPTGTSSDDTTSHTLQIPQHMLQQYRQQGLDPTACTFVSGLQKREKECPVCYEDIADTDVLIREAGCQHTFCAECFLQSTEVGDKCPMCRRRVATQRPSPAILNSNTHTIEDYIYHSMHQLIGYFEDPEVTADALAAAFEGVDACLHLSLQTSISFIRSVESQGTGQTDATRLLGENMLESILEDTRAIVAMLADPTLPRRDRLLAATNKYRGVATTFEALTLLFPELEVVSEDDESSEDWNSYWNQFSLDEEGMGEL